MKKGVFAVGALFLAVGCQSNEAMLSVTNPKNPGQKVVDVKVDPNAASVRSPYVTASAKRPVSTTSPDAPVATPSSTPTADGRPATKAASTKQVDRNPPSAYRSLQQNMRPTDNNSSN